MSGTASQLPAYKGLRGEVLLELKRAQPRTAKQLADTLGVSPNAVRHHLKELEAESLIARSEEHTSELQSHSDLVCRLLLEKKKKQHKKKNMEIIPPTETKSTRQSNATSHHY